MDIKLEKGAVQICRICLQEIEPNYPLLYLNFADSQNRTIQDKLIECIPELNLNAVPNAVICNECSIALSSAYNFKLKCLRTEMQIKKCLQQLNATTLFDLAEVQRMDVVNKTVKVEELVMPDLKMELDDGSFSGSAIVDEDFNISTQEVLKDHYTDSEYTDAYYSCYMCDYTTESNSDFSLHVENHADASLCVTMDELTADSNLKSKEEVSNNPCGSLLPDKSKTRYNRTFEVFMKWCTTKNFAEITESVMLEYFLERSNILKSPASLWSEYSMLKLTMFQNRDQDISKFEKVKTFLKRENNGFQPRKSKVFTKEEIEKFLFEAPDELYLMMKVIMILGVAGGCNTHELHKMKLQNIEFKDDIAVVRMPERKKNIRRSFVIMNDPESTADWLKIIQNYIKLRPKNTTHERFFFRYERGRCLNQVVGKHTISKIPREIAKFLKLEDIGEYTGHSFRRTSASYMAST